MKSKFTIVASDALNSKENAQIIFAVKGIHGIVALVLDSGYIYKDKNGSNPKR